MNKVIPINEVMSRPLNYKVIMIRQTNNLEQCNFDTYTAYR